MVNPRRSRQQKGRPVDFINNKKDLKAVVDGCFFVGRAVEERIDMSQGRIAYRFKMLGIKRKEIRDGSSPIGQLIYQEAKDRIEAMLLRNYIRKHL